MAIAFVTGQQATNNAASGTTLALTLPGATTVGNTLVLQWAANLADLSSVSGGGVWKLAKGTGSNHTFSAIWYCVVTSAITVVTLTFAGTTASTANVAEFSGVSTNPIDTSSSGTGSSTTPTTGSFTPSVANCLVIAMDAARGAYSSGPDSSFTGLTRDGNGANSVFIFPSYSIQTTATAVNVGWVQASASWDTAGVVLVPVAQPNAFPLGRTWNTTAGNKTVVATPAIGDLLVVICANSGRTTAQPPTVADDNSSGTYTRHGTAMTKNTSADSAWIFVRDALVTAATSTTVTMTQTSDTGGGLQVWAISGLTSRLGLAAIRQVGKQDNGSAAGTPSITMGSAVLTGNPVVGAVFNTTNSSTTTAPPTSWIEDGDSGYATPASGFETAHRPGLETNTTIAWTAASASAFGAIIAELDTTAGSVSPAGGNAAGTGASNQPAAQVSPNAGSASGTGAANQPATSLNPNAGSAAGTGTANTPAASISGSSGVATGSGTANAPAVALQVNAGSASGTGTAYDASIVTVASGSPRQPVINFTNVGIL